MSNRYHRKCCVPQCTSKYRGSFPGISFHRFPKDAKYIAHWKDLLKIDKPLTHNLSVCSLHFIDEDFYYKGVGSIRNRLKRNVKPSKHIPDQKPNDLVAKSSSHLERINIQAELDRDPLEITSNDKLYSNTTDNLSDAQCSIHEVYIKIENDFEEYDNFGDHTMDNNHDLSTKTNTAPKIKTEDI